MPVKVYLFWFFQTDVQWVQGLKGIIQLVRSLEKISYLAYLAYHPTISARFLSHWGTFPGEVHSLREELFSVVSPLFTLGR